jgi:hypothetical protein
MIRQRFILAVKKYGLNRSAREGMDYSQFRGGDPQLVLF